VLSSWLLGVGLLAICLEMHRIRIGHRVHNLLRSREAILERVRRLEVRYNRMVRPDLLLKQVPDSFRPGERLASLGPRLERLIQGDCGYRSTVRHGAIIQFSPKRRGDR